MTPAIRPPNSPVTLGVSDATFCKWRKQWEWPARGPVKRGAGPANAANAADEPVATKKIDVGAAIAALDDDATAPSNERIAAALRRALYAEVAVLMAGSGSKHGSEARARALASIGQTLAILGGGKDAALKETGTDTDDEADAPPVNIADLRHELARRLHLISQARNSS